MGVAHHPLWPCSRLLEITFLEPSWHRSQSSHRLNALKPLAHEYSLSRTPPPTHSHVGPRMSHSKQQLLLWPPPPKSWSPYLSHPCRFIYRENVCPLLAFRLPCTSMPAPHLHCRGWNICQAPDELQAVKTSKPLCSPGADAYLPQGGLNTCQSALPWWLSPRVPYIVSLSITATLS